MEYDPLLGRIISERYRIIDYIGEGGMGVVYLAEHETLPRRYAIKILKSEYLENGNFVERFRREAIAASRVVHPGIVYITDFGQIKEGNYYIVMEYLEGEGLDSLLESQGKIPLSRAVNVLIQVADALDHAHKAGVVHRDLKAENVLLTREMGRKDVVKLLDFGIARLLLPSCTNTRITEHGQVFGTPEYMSPEQASDQTIDGRSDIYSLGVLAYELVTGMPPFYHEDPTETLQAHISQKPQAPSIKMPDQVIPKIFDGVVLKCLAKKPEARFQTARKLKTELIRVRNVISSMASKLVEPTPALLESQEKESLEFSEVENFIKDKSVLEIRNEYHQTLKEIFLKFLNRKIISEPASKILNDLIQYESEIAGLNSTIAFKEQLFEDIRFEFGQKIEKLKYAIMDLSHEHSNYLENNPEEKRDEEYVKDLEFQIKTLKEKFSYVEAEKKDKIVNLNQELTKYRESVEIREQEAANLYASMDYKIEKIIDNIDLEDAGISSTYEKLQHLKFGLHSLRVSND
ncbi:MAG: serine/threonine protein kinase [Myxococcota bacterium]